MYTSVVAHSARYPVSQEIMKSVIVPPGLPVTPLEVEVMATGEESLLVLNLRVN